MAHTILLGNETAPGVHPAWVSVTGTDQTAGVVLVGFFYVNGRTQIDSWQHGIAPGDGLEPQGLQELADNEQATVVSSEFFAIDGMLVPGSDFGAHAVAVSGFGRSTFLSSSQGDYQVTTITPSDPSERNEVREI